jgi:hypothetical protein
MLTLFSLFLSRGPSACQRGPSSHVHVSEVRVIKHVIAGLTALLVAGCGHMALNDDSNASAIPPIWKPTTSIAQAGSIDLTGRANARLRVEVTDNRSDPGFIGRNSEKLPPRKVTTADGVTAFVNEHMKQLISGTGVIEVDDAGIVILKTEIQQFFVEETETYNGDVRLKVILVNSSGNQVWTGITSGSSIRFGRSYSAANCYETLGDTLIDAVHNLMQSETFRAALAGVS